LLSTLEYFLEHSSCDLGGKSPPHLLQSKSGHGSHGGSSFCHLMEIAITRLISRETWRGIFFYSVPLHLAGVYRANAREECLGSHESQPDNTLSQNLNGTEHFFIQIIKKEAQNDEEVTP
jgi:hypothetical protein